MSGKGELYCSFCGSALSEVHLLIAGPTVFICDGCVGLCNEILSERARKKTEQLIFGQSA